MTLSFRYSALFVPDVAATVSFYEKAFGFRLRYMHASQGYAELETGDTLLAFVGDKFAADLKLLGETPYLPNLPGNPAAGAQLAFVTNDMEQDWRRAISAGAIVATAPQAKPWGQTTGYLRDCNGFIVELCTRSPRDPEQISG
jgi:lactoylglutathione lyase